MVDALGNLMRFVLLPGRRHDGVGVEPLIDNIAIGALDTDRAFDIDALRQKHDERGVTAVIPPKADRKRPIFCDFTIATLPPRRSASGPRTDSQASARNVAQIAFRPDWPTHGKAAPFKRSDALLEALSIGVLVFPGNSIQDNLANKARKLGIPVWKIASTK